MIFVRQDVIKMQIEIVQGATSMDPDARVLGCISREMLVKTSDPAIPWQMFVEQVFSGIVDVFREKRKIMAEDPLKTDIKPLR